MGSVRSVTCVFCGKKSSAPCPTKQVADKCVRNTKIKKPLNTTRT